MMPFRGPEEESATAGMALARAAREAVAAMRRVLLGSEEPGREMAAIEDCMPRLEHAVITMQELSAAAPGRDCMRLRRELAELKNDLLSVGRLARRGEAFCQSLACLLGVAEGGYTPGGEGAPLQPTGSLALRG
jgi:hypothetical protein